MIFTACNETTNAESDDSTGEVESEDLTSEVEEDIQTIYSDNVITWGTIIYKPSDAALSNLIKDL